MVKDDAMLSRGCGSLCIYAFNVPPTETEPRPVARFQVPGSS